MKYVALLRGINVGGNRKVEMKRLKGMFEELGFTEVSTYINTGNVLFSTDMKSGELRPLIEKHIAEEFGFEVQTLVKSIEEMRAVAKALPEDWTNNTEQKTDVAYLFPEIDSAEVIAQLPVNLEVVEVRYVRGALIWNVKRENYNRSRLNKLVGHKLYKLMTLRNANTARALAKDIFDKN